MSVRRRDCDWLTRDDAELPPGLQTRALVTQAGERLDLRAAASTGSFEGYACIWDVVDAYGTRFAPACFSAGGLDGGDYALLRMHDPNEAIGVFTAREDDYGLWIAGSWDATPEGEAGRARARSGSAPELSVGFVPMMVDPDDPDRFTQVRLVEVSQITARMAAVPGAGFAAARSTLPRGVPGHEQQQHEPTDDERAAGGVIASVLLALSQRAR